MRLGATEHTSNSKRTKMEYGKRISWSIDTAMQMVEFQQHRIEALEREIERLNGVLVQQTEKVYENA